MSRKYKGRTDDHPQEWEEKFLAHYSDYGGITLSAKEAGVTVPMVKARTVDSPAFAEKFEEAKELLADRHEKLLVQMAKGEIKSTGFLALIARLKAERPNKYNDKLQVSGAVAHLHSPVAQAEVQELLVKMLSDITPESRAALTDGGGVIDVTATRVDD